MKLLCFPGFTCGGFLCNILNFENSRAGAANNISSPTHALAKIDTINWHTGRGFDVNDFYNKLYKNYPMHKPNTYVGTHCWPGDFDTDRFTHIINITTQSRLSKIYRHTRVYWTYVNGQFPDYNSKINHKFLKPQEPSETAYDFNQSFNPVQKNNIINIEFDEVVNFTSIFQNYILNLIGSELAPYLIKRHTEWCQLNKFLFDDRIKHIFKLWDEAGI